MTEPKLLTEAEARNLWAQPHARDHFIELLRERGLIAEEPVDPLLIEAREIVARVVGAGGASWFGGEFRKGKCDDHQSMQVALAALKRGREIEREAASPLTRDDCKSALIVAGYCATPNGVNRLHAALTKQVQQ